ncbi:hypothetical protein BHE74_00039668 [Ensete ventricosum]|nr:hypothetical protein BHE74_00039668 [Ensete ventricosum]
MSDWAPKDSNAAMRARWSNLSYTIKGWDDSQAASEFEWGVLLPTLAKDLYTLPFEILMAQAAKQIMLMTLLDRVHDVGRLVTLMGDWASHLEVEVTKLKSEGDPEQLAATRLGHHYQVALFDRVHDVGRLVTLMGNRASHLEAEVAKLKSEGDPKQLAIARQ